MSDNEPLPLIYDSYTDAEVEAMERQYLADQEWRTDYSVRMSAARLVTRTGVIDRLVSSATPQELGVANAQRNTNTAS